MTRSGLSYISAMISLVPRSRVAIVNGEMYSQAIGTSPLRRSFKIEIPPRNCSIRWVWTLDWATRSTSAIENTVVFSIMGKTSSGQLTVHPIDSGIIPPISPIPTITQSNEYFSMALMWQSAISWSSSSAERNVFPKYRQIGAS